MSDVKTIRITSDTVESAILRAEEALKLTREEFKTRVVQEGSTEMLRKQKAIVEFSFDTHEQELKERESRIEGFLDIKITDKGIYLKVDPIPEELSSGTAYMVRRYLHRKNIFGVDPESLSGMVEQHSGRYLLLQEPHLQTISAARISVTKSPDMMFATLIRYDLEPLGRGELLKYLEEINVTYGLRDEVLSDLCNESLLNNSVIIAEGEAPVTEIRGPMKHNFETQAPSIKLDETDQVDFKNVMRLIAVKKGEVLVEKTEPIEGRPGRSISGQEIPFNIDHDGPIPHGPGTVTSEDGRELIAGTDGRLVFENGIVSVELLYVVDGDVDYHTGNIDFDGAVTVTGDVLPGFEITATGNIEVRGVVDGGILRTKGNVLAKQGIFAKESGHIEADGDLVARHIEGMKIRARKVRVFANIINADIVASDCVEVFGSPGTIMGGRVEAKYHVKANTIGNHIGNETTIVVGDAENATDGMIELARSIRHVREQLAKVTKILASFEAREEDADELMLEPGKALELSSLEKQLRCDLKKHDEEMGRFLQEEKKLKASKIHFRDVAHEGVRLFIYTAHLAIAKAAERGTVVWENESLKITPYHYAEGT